MAAALILETSAVSGNNNQQQATAATTRAVNINKSVFCHNNQVLQKNVIFELHKTLTGTIKQCCRLSHAYQLSHEFHKKMKNQKMHTSQVAELMCQPLAEAIQPMSRQAAAHLCWECRYKFITEH